MQGTAGDLSRVLVVTKFTNVYLKYSLFPVPHSLVNHDGTLAKTDKAALSRFLEQYAEQCTNDKKSTAWIVDAVAVIQLQKQISATFGELSQNIPKSMCLYCNNQQLCKD